MSLGGDLGDNIAPTPERGFYQVLKDPLALGVLLDNQVYPNPNRFFAHWSVKTYFRSAPIFLQRFTDPIESIYLSSALAKILVQILILYLLAVYISNTRNPFKLDFLAAAALMFPLFQTWGYNRYMGIIDQSVVYVFFYALPAGLLGLFFLPFFRGIYYGSGVKFSFAGKLLLALSIPVLTMNGPLIPGIVLVACPLIILGLLLQNYRNFKPGEAENQFLSSFKKIPHNVLIFFAGIIIFSLYSLYIGRNNSVTINESIPLLERYSKLPGGLHDLVTSKLGFPFLFLMIIINLIMIRRNYRTPESDRLISFLKWVGIFAVLYMLMLPFGGYRSYRPDILRYDTFIPVSLGIFFAFGASGFYLLKNLRGGIKIAYTCGIILVLLMITNADRVNKTDYLCERQALEQIASSKDSIVALDADCKIMDWRKTNDPLIRELDAELLLIWSVTDTKKLFYQKD